MILFAKSAFFLSRTNQFSIGITIDLLFTIPLSYYLLIKKTTIPKTTIILFLILGMVVATKILPPQNQSYLTFFKTWIFPLIEISVLGLIIFKVKQTTKLFKANQNTCSDFYTTLKNSCYEILPKAAVMPVATEIAVFYYGFINWKKKIPKENEFTYHKESGTIPVMVSILGLILIETFVIHLLVVRWNALVATILLFLSIYSGIQFFGFLRSMSKRPILVHGNQLFLRYGIMNETTVEIEQIDKIEISSKDLEESQETRKMSLLGSLESHNIIIYLKEENTLFGLYGIKRKYKNLALFVDNPKEFEFQINQALKSIG